MTHEHIFIDKHQSKKIEIFFHIETYGSITQKECRKLGITGITVSKWLRDFVEAQYLQVIQQPKKVKLYILTDKGILLISAFRKHLELIYE